MDHSYDTLLAVKKDFSFHDANIEEVELKDNRVKIEAELLNEKSKDQQRFKFLFYDYSDLVAQHLLKVDWGNSSGTILKYKIESDFVEFFVEITDYGTSETNYDTLSFSYQKVSIILM